MGRMMSIRVRALVVLSTAAEAEAEVAEEADRSNVGT
jgi:hypothetical protein